MVHKVIHPNIHFSGQHKEEKVEIIYRRHVFFLVIGYIWSFILGICTLILYFWLPSIIPFFQEGIGQILYEILILGTILFLVFTVFLIWVHYYLDSYIVTNERVLSVDQVDFFHRKIAEADIGNIEDIEVIVKGVFATTINYGDVRIQTAGADSRTLFFNDIPEPYIAKNIILKLSEKNKNSDLHRAYTYKPKEEVNEKSI